MINNKEEHNDMVRIHAEKLCFRKSSTYEGHDQQQQQTSRQRHGRKSCRKNLFQKKLHIQGMSTNNKQAHKEDIVRNQRANLSFGKISTYDT